MIRSLDALRGLAALTVCLFHVQPMVPMNWPILNGHGAVVLFFVLSGYVLRLSLDKNPNQFYVIARLFRIYPVAIVTVAVMVLLGWEGHFLRNALLIDVSINGAFWTLQVELFGSLLILLAHRLNRPWMLYPLTAALIGLSFFGTRIRIVAGVDLGFMYPFLVGYLLVGWRISRPLLALGLALVAFYGAAHAGYVLKQWLLLVTVLSAAVIVLAVSQFPNALRPAWGLGALSYSFYAVHPIALHLTEGWIALIVAPLITILLAIPMHFLIEKPGMRLGKALTAQRLTPA